MISSHEMNRKKSVETIISFSNIHILNTTLTHKTFCQKKCPVLCGFAAFVDESLRSFTSILLTFFKI